MAKRHKNPKITWSKSQQYFYLDRMELHNSAKGMKSNNPKGGWYWSSSLLLSFFSSLAVDAMAFNAICSIPFLNRCSVPLKCSKAMSSAALKNEINGIICK